MRLLPKAVALPLALSFALAVAACDNQQQQAASAAPAPEVTITTLTANTVPLYTDLPGRTAAYRIAEVRPQVSGIVLKRLFTEGSEVEAGQQLYQIDPSTYQAAVQSAEADLAKARASLKSVQAKAARYAELVKINAVSRQDYDDAVASMDQARADIMVAQAAVDTAKISLEYTKVYAPISGRIGKSAITEGALVTANQTATMATITQLDPIYVDVSQSSSDLMRLRQAVATGLLQKGQTDQAPVTLSLDGSNQPYAHAGQLQFSDVTVDESTGAVQVRAVFPNPEKALYPGMFVRARVEQGVRENALLVPQRAVVRQPDGSAAVWLVGPDNKVALSTIKTIQGQGDQWLVESGVKAGDKVVIEGLQKIRAGIEVRPVDPTAAPAPADAAAPAAAKQ